MWNIYDHIRLLSRWDRAVGLISSLQIAIHQGDVVLDAGCGSGIISLLAVKNGASKVLGVDCEPIDLAQLLAEENGLSEQVSFIQAELRNLSLPDQLGKIDVITSMIYNNDPRRDELQSSIIFELIKRYLTHQGGRILPDRVRYLAYACDWPAFDIESGMRSIDRDIIEMEGRFKLSFDSVKSLVKEQVDVKFFPVRNMKNGRIGSGNDNLLLSDSVLFCEIDYYQDSFSYPSSFNIDIASVGRMNTIIWVQELWYRDILIFSNESLTYIGNAKEVKQGDRVTILIDDNWRRSNVARLI